jgi:hypothetical protein
MIDKSGECDKDRNTLFLGTTTTTLLYFALRALKDSYTLHSSK